MSASTYEYKTVALPQTVQGKRKRGTSEADLVAGTFGEVIHLEAVEGWEYMRADILAAGTRGGMFSKEPTITYYSVLVFRRTMEATWAVPRERTEAEPQPVAPPTAQPMPQARSAASSPVIDATPVSAPAAPVRPRPAPVPPREPIAAPAPAAKRPVVDPTSPLAQGMVLSTGGQFRTDGGSFGTISEGASEPGASPRPPLGSAQD